MGLFVKASKKNTFRVELELYSPRRSRAVKQADAFTLYGFNPSMTLEEARLHAKMLNAQDQIQNRRKGEAARRVQESQEVTSAYLPAHQVQGFELELEENYRDNSERLDTVRKHWKTVQKVIVELELYPKDFYAERNRFINYFKNKKWSPDYIKRINRMLNLWGSYVSRRSLSFYQPIPKLSGNQIQKIVELREDLDDVRIPAPSLKWIELKNLESTFENQNLRLQWNWLYIALWFGLRPIEVDNLKDNKYWEIIKPESHQYEVLRVFQTKLTSLPKDKRWKPIPIFFDEQQKALELIRSGAFKRPLNKTLQRIFKTPIETYSPRKGFTDLMLDKKVSFEDISIFLGHCDISTTWRYYKDKFTFKIPG